MVSQSDRQTENMMKNTSIKIQKHESTTPSNTKTQKPFCGKKGRIRPLAEISFFVHSSRVEERGN